MKKTIAVTLGLFLTATVAFAAIGYIELRFKDEADFAPWYRDSVERMKLFNVMKGYDDGTFKPGNNVNRAELAVILDKFEQKLTEDRTEDFQNKIQIVLTKWDAYKNDKITDGFRVPVVMAEAGLRYMSAPPVNLSELKLMTQDYKGNPMQLPQGYTAYEQQGIVFSYYLHFVGNRLEGDVGLDVDQWFGPFTNY